jgi:hypothetical protein
LFEVVQRSEFAGRLQSIHLLQHDEFVVNEDIDRGASGSPVLLEHPQVAMLGRDHAIVDGWPALGGRLGWTAGKKRDAAASSIVRRYPGRAHGRREIDCGCRGHPYRCRIEAHCTTGLLRPEGMMKHSAG